MNSLTEQISPSLTVTPGAPLWRRLLAIFYDTIIVICVVFIAWVPSLLMPSELWPDWLSKTAGLSYDFIITFGFFGWFWTHGGQTIGMRAWSIRLVDHQSLQTEIANPSWSQALRHYLMAIVSWGFCGLGFLASLFDSEKRTWHERIAGTALVVQRNQEHT